MKERDSQEQPNVEERPIGQEQLSCPRGDANCKFVDEIVGLRDQVKNLIDQVRTDALTGLYNFRFFNETIALEMERAKRGAQPLAMILLDVDYFKKFNDKWGHEEGNRALIHVASLIKVAIRKLDVACRFGGEEFVILLPNTEIHQAVHVAERIRLSIETTLLELSEAESVGITASFGVDQFLNTMSDTTEGFVKRVDSWLYTAKQGGRNKVSYPDLVIAAPASLVTHAEKSALFDEFKNSD
jgi:diguanylate cyclase (GGDEF)-like protein